MTQNNLYMEDDNLRLYVDVQPTFIDELENSKNAAAASATLAAQSASNAQSWLNDIISYKTNLELYYAQSINNLSNWYNDTVAELANLKNTCLQAITTLSDSVLSSISSLYQQIINTIQTTGQSYINQTREYAEQARDAVDNRVSEEYLIQSNALESGSVSNITNVLADISKYAHSSFCGYQASTASPLDPKKFVKVGSPTITDDGIVSGFSSSNYLKIPTSNFVPSNNTWIINCGKIKTYSSFSSQQTIFSIVNNTNGVVLTRIETDGTVLFAINYSDNTWGAIGTSTISLSTNTEYYTRIKYTGSQYILECSLNEANWTTLVSLDYSNSLLSFSDINIGYYQSGTSFSWLGSIDLKQFSITVDGVPVFSGNKTGIDTIKSDDYIIVGTPTISADGVASGFSSSNYLTASPSNLILGNNFEVIVGFTTDSTLTGYQGLCRFLNSSNIAETVLYKGNNLTRLECALAGNYYTIINTLIPNTEYLIKMKVQNNTYSCYYSTNNGKTWLQDNPTQSISINITNAIATMLIGNNTVEHYWKGSIDLNAFKIYVDGNLVYQPCLKIPFILSSDKYGSKIVDSIYRDRVKDAFEQGFEQRYYTLDENNGNYTLPMGDIYGMIENLRKQIAQIAEQGE